MNNAAVKIELEPILEAKYGLPNEVKFCKSCIISNQRPNSSVEYKHTKNSKKETIHFNANGDCDACKVSEKKNTIDWDAREKELIELCDKYRSKNGQYDCLLPGSGGKDSIYAAHILKEKYKMNPLTLTWAPHIYTPWGWENFQAWIHAGFDNILHTPNGRVHRLLTRLAVDNLFHPFQPFIIGQKALAPKVAAQHGIELVFYGEDEAEYGNPQSDMETAIRDFKYFTGKDESKIYLSGVSIKELKQSYGLTQQDLLPYLPAAPEELIQRNVGIHYLGYYLKWHPQSCYYYAAEHAGFQASPERTAGTYSKYSGIDDKMDDLHFYTTYIKFGIGRATYDAAQEVRSDDITREEALALVKRFDGEFPERFADELFRYLSINEKEFPIASQQFEQAIMDRNHFMELADQFRSPHLWTKDNGEWRLRHTPWEER